MWQQHVVYDICNCLLLMDDGVRRGFLQESSDKENDAQWMIFID